MRLRYVLRPALALLLLTNDSAARAERLDQVIVTATRRPGALIDHPGSVSRIATDTVALTGATHGAELLNRVPGAMIQRGSGQESLTALRSPVLTGAGACGAVLVLEDGIPIRPVGTCNVNELFEVNVEQAAAVELLRGPGSALYGSSAVHGIVNVIPPRPEDLPSFGFGLEGGSGPYRRVRLAAGAGDSSSGLGLAMHATDDGGWRAASGFAEQKLNAVWTRSRDAHALTVRLAVTNLEQETAGFIQGEDSYRDPVLARSNPNPEAYRDAHSLRTSLAYDHASGFSLRGYARSSRMDFLQHFLLGQPLEDNGQDSGGLMMSFAKEGFGGGALLLGLDADFAASTLFQFQDGPTTDGSPGANAIRPAGRHYDYAVDSSVLAAYAHWRRPLSPQWSVEAGLRFERVQYDYDNRMIDGNSDETGVPCPGGCLYSRPADRSDDFTELAPRLGLVWRPRDGIAAYASLARGFRAPETTELYRLQRQQTFADLEPERIDAAEIGWRMRRGGAALDVAAFQMDKQDVILRDSAGFNVSGGRTRHRGIEYQADWDFASGWALSGAGTFAEHEYRFTAAVEQGEQITAGNEIDTAPRHIHAVRLRHDAERTSAELEWLHVGSYWTNAANTARYGGHDLANLRMSFRPGTRWSLAVRITNLLDAAYADRADFAFGNHRYFPGRGRAYFLALDWRED
ncbi:MAG TPA: TonB-dependent receptor [Steroidobacteraceae bacterium]|nr:TonB-dependent receptor [Steroidobacteraceae bacterium]